MPFHLQGKRSTLSLMQGEKEVESGKPPRPLATLQPRRVPEMTFYVSLHRILRNTPLFILGCLAQ